MNKDEIAREEILRAAEVLFQKWGLKKTTMEDIARQAGKAKSSLYYYFKDKSEILYAVLEDQLIRILKIAEAAVEKETSAKDKLFAYVYTTFKEIRDTITLFDVLRGEVIADGEIVKNIRKSYDVLDEKYLRAILEYGFKRKEFKSASPRNIDSITRALVNVKRSLMTNIFLENDEEELIGVILDVMYKGI